MLPGVRLSIRRERHEALPYRLPADHAGLRIASQVLAELYATTPVQVRMGGTLPVSELFQRLLGIYTVFFSFSTADEDFHAPNEFFRLHRLEEGLELTVAWFLQSRRRATPLPAARMSPSRPGR